MRQDTKLRRQRKKAVGRAPNYLKTVAIAKKPHRREGGTFGAAFDCISIDPVTGLPFGAPVASA